MNAWQRPLSLAASADMPDPRAVGTGKPSSSLMNKANIVPTQAVPENTPLVTPSVLPPIGTSNLNNTAPIGSTNLNSTAPIGSSNLSSTAPIGSSNVNNAAIGSTN